MILDVHLVTFRVRRHDLVDRLPESGIGLLHNACNGDGVGVAGLVCEKDAHRGADDRGCRARHHHKQQRNAARADPCRKGAHRRAGSFGKRRRKPIQYPSNRRLHPGAHRLKAVWPEGRTRQYAATGRSVLSRLPSPHRSLLEGQAFSLPLPVGKARGRGGHGCSCCVLQAFSFSLSFHRLLREKQATHSVFALRLG